MANIDAISPNSITRPRLAPRMPAAAIGPGVGGTRQWVAVRPRPRAIAGPASEILALFESALFKGDKITKPESANTGIETK